MKKLAASVLVLAIVTACAAGSQSPPVPSDNGNPTVFLEGQAIAPQTALFQTSRGSHAVTYAFFDSGDPSLADGTIYARYTLQRVGAVVQPSEYASWERVTLLRGKNQNCENIFKEIRNRNEPGGPWDPRDVLTPNATADSGTRLGVCIGGANCLPYGGTVRPELTLQVGQYSIVRDRSGNDFDGNGGNPYVSYTGKLIPPVFGREHCKLR